MSVELVNILTEFQEAGPRHYFRLVDGTHCQGYIDEVTPTTIIFIDSGPFARDLPYVFPLTDVLLETLSYWDQSRNAWLDFKPQSKTGSGLLLR